MKFVAGLVMIFLMAATIHLMNGGKVRASAPVAGASRTFLDKCDFGGWLYAILVAAAWWFVIKFGPTFTGATFWYWVLHIGLFAVSLAAIVGLVFWWRNPMKGGSEPAELILFAILIVAFCWAATVEAAMLAGLFKSDFVLSLLTTIAWTVGTLAFGVMLVDLCLFYRDMRATPGSSEQNRAHVCAWFFMVLFLIFAILLLALGVKWNAIPKKSNDIAIKGPTVTATPAPTPKSTPVPTPEPTAEPEPEEEEAWYVLRHLLVLEDEEKSNDDDFGPNPLTEIFARKVACGELTPKDLENKTEKELYQLVADDILDYFFEVLEQDPVKGAADMGYYDVIHGTRFLGAFVTELLDHPDALMEHINAKSREWLEDQDEYLRVLEIFKAALLDSDEIVISYVKSGLDDQMYMTSFTLDGIPDVIVMTSHNHSGFMLTFRDYIKGTEKKEVQYRADCDFQPTNVSKVAPVTVIPNPREPDPTPTPTATPSPSPTPTATPVPPPPTWRPVPPPTPTPTPPPPPPSPTPTIPIPSFEPKDPTKGTDVGPDDVPGPGPDTNNGRGAKESKDEQPSNSLHDTLDEYWDKLEELEEPQKEAGDSNEPSYVPEPPPAPPPAIDNNGDEGTGYGGADDPTPIVPEVTYTDPDTGETGSFADEEPGEEWDFDAP